jgi:hypothetical protein
VAALAFAVADVADPAADSALEAALEFEVSAADA